MPAVMEKLFLLSKISVYKYGLLSGVQNVLSALDGKAEMVVDCVCVCLYVCGHSLHSSGVPWLLSVLLHEMIL